MIERPFSSVTRADVDALVASARREDRLIEYKRSLPSNSDHDKREFLADVSAFANAAGGDLLYGVDEEDGVPTAVPGLTISSVDDEILRLQSILRDGIQPRIPALEIRAIEAIGVDPVILLRVHPSWTGPHMVVFKGGSRFFVRDVGQRHQLDVNELRDAFVAAEGVGERLRRFRDERVAKVLIGDTPIATWSHPATIIHVIPAMLRRGNSLDPRAVGDKWMVLNETKFIYYPSSRINFDGLLLYSGPAYEHDKRSHSYVQVFRTVAVEAVSTFSNRAEPYMNFY
ncbi:MAG TPA: ATP-binding protein, partial [Thermoanaerobaculia bacterium]|nr:ATP-binding protein [Thermoanaerobaculia bacterium]